MVNVMESEQAGKGSGEKKRKKNFKTRLRMHQGITYYHSKEQAHNGRSVDVALTAPDSC